MALGAAILPVALGWLGLGTVAVGLLWVARLATDRSLVRSERSPSLAEMSPMFAVFVAIVGWVIWLGFSL